jgi:hypothetical protein
MRKSLTFLSSAFLVVLCFTIGIFAQQTTGEISGTIVDANGAVVPGASVTVSGTNVGYTRTVTAKDDGTFLVQQVPPGQYKVSVGAISGFAAQTKENVQVGINNRTTVDFTMGTSTSVVVDVQGGDNIVDATETKAQDNFSTREIDALPKGTNFTSLLRTTASVRPEPLGGQLTINGATGPENSFIIDGQETQNFINGMINTNNDIPYQALQELQVKTSGFEAEFGGATGGVVNAVTKSGANQFHGEFGIAFDTPKFDAGPRPIYRLQTSTSGVAGGSSADSGQGIEVLPLERPRGLSTFPTALFSGPIVKDRLWFFAIHSPRYINEERTVTYISGYGPTRTLTTLSPALIALGATNTQDFRRETVYQYSQIRLDGNPFRSLRLSSSWTWNPIELTGELPNSFVIGSPTTVIGPDGVAFAQGAEAARFKGGRQNSNNFRFEGTYTPSSKWFAIGRYTRGFMNEKLGAYGVFSGPQYVCSQVPASQQAAAGCAQGFVNVSSNSAVKKDVSIRTAYDAQTSYIFSAGGRHELKGGYQHSVIENDVATGNAGVGRTYLYYGVNCFDPSFTYVQWHITQGNTYPCPADSIGTGVTYQFGTNGQAKNTADTFFIQDKWQIGNRLTFNVGLRTEQEKIPAYNSDAIDLKFKFADKLAPRLGVAYALTRDGKTKISAFYGRFFDRLKFALPRGSFGGDFYHVSYFYIRSGAPAYTNYTVQSLAGSYGFPAGGSCPNPPGSQYVCDQDYRIASNSPDADPFETGQVDPNVKPYRQSEVTAEFQREVWRSSVFTARYLWRNLDEVIEDIGIPSDAGEAYIMGNPGSGLAKEVYETLGYNKIPKAVRKYNALQLELNSRYFRKFNVNLNYTWSRLKGNFSGLASPDEVSVVTGVGRSTTPNVNRDFDEPWVGFTGSGNEAIGILPLDRTHVVKASGTYSHGWGNTANTTDLSFFTTAQSGTPLTTFINVFGIPIPETKRGDLGRTEMFTQTDLNLTHRYSFGRDNRLTMAFDFNVNNVFNENNVLAVNQNKHSTFFVFSQDDIPGCGGDTVCAVNYLTSNGILSQYAAAEEAFDPTGTTPCNAANPVCGVNAARNLAFRQPINYQNPRNVRFGFRLIF